MVTVRQAEALLTAVIAARATSFMFSKSLVGILSPFDVLAVRFLLAAALSALLFHKRLASLSVRTLKHGGAIGIAFFATMAFEMHALQGASSSTVSFLENMAVAFVPLATALSMRRLPRLSMTAALVIVCTGFGFTLQPLAQKHLSADTAGLICALSPLVATLMGWMFLGEPLTLLRLAGMAAVMASLFVADASLGKRKTPAGLGRAGVACDRRGEEGDWEGIASRPVDV